MNLHRNKQFFLGVLAACTLAVSGPVSAGGLAGFFDRLFGADVEQIIVRLESYEGSEAEQGISAQQLARLQQAAGIELGRVRRMSGNGRVLRLPQGMSLKESKRIAARIASVPGVVYAVPDRVMQIQAIPNDPRFTEQWQLYEAAGGIEMPGAWDITTGAADVYVAVLDTGIRGAHEDLTGRSMGGFDFISRRRSANDGDGRDADATDPGDYRFFSRSSWHGSHVAGTIGAAGNNGIGVSGINWVSQIVPVRVLGRRGGATSDILDGMRWAAGLNVPGIPDNLTPVQVMNLSLGGPGPCDDLWQATVDDIVAAGTVVVVAAGNSASPSEEFTPAGCDQVITVAATDRAGELASYSNFGTAVEISAPGGGVENNVVVDGILSTVDSGNRKPEGDTYADYVGTSMAAPHVAGVVSLLKSVDPSLTPAQVLDAIQQTAKPFPAGTQCASIGNLCGAGIIDAEAALMHIAQP